MATHDERYNINLAGELGHLRLIDVPSLVSECSDKWFNQTLCHVNDCVVRLGIVQGEFHWHHHDNEDEMFVVLDGQLFVDLENETITLDPHCGYTVPRGVKHRTRALKRTVMLMIEGGGVKPTGD